MDGRFMIGLVNLEPDCTHLSPHTRGGAEQAR
jgi:hypothetical protein